MKGATMVFPLKGVIQHYSWGGFSFLPGLLNIGNPEKKPFAEYWLGMHGAHPALVCSDGAFKALPLFLSENGFPPLTYLLKVLDVRQMLSIQVHPDKLLAEKGYLDETANNISPHAPNRNYKDQNHKPELMAALGDFWLLHGFRPKDSLLQILAAVKELNFLTDIFITGGYEALYRKVMHLPQTEVNEILDPLINRIMPMYRDGTLNKNQPDFWAARAADTYSKDGQYDRGIFSIYLFNLVHLRKGEAVFQPSGLPHAYLEGQNVEIMANSDNVLRAGLTDKHIDIPELIKHVRYEHTIPVIINPEGADRVFETTAAEFELRQHHIREERTLQATSVEIWIMMEGSASIDGTTVHSGDALLILPGHAVKITPGTTSVLYRAALPAGGKNK